MKKPLLALAILAFATAARAAPQDNGPQKPDPAVQAAIKACTDMQTETHALEWRAQALLAMAQRDGLQAQIKELQDELAAAKKTDAAQPQK